MRVCPQYSIKFTCLCMSEEEDLIMGSLRIADQLVQFQVMCFCFLTVSMTMNQDQ